MVHTCTAQKVGLAIKALVEHGVVQNNGRLAPLPAWLGMSDQAAKVDRAL
jgi:hypothetical protein